MDCFVDVSQGVFGLEASTADVFDGVAKVVVKLLVSDKIPDFYGSALVIAW
jgi:hypothetical protein